MLSQNSGDGNNPDRPFFRGWGGGGQAFLGLCLAHKIG